MAIVNVSIVPLGTNSPSLSQYVTRAIKVVERNGHVKYQLTPMGTILEGDLDGVLSIIRQMHESVFSEGVQRVLTTIKIDDRRDKTATMKSKISSVESKLRRG